MRYACSRQRDRTVCLRVEKFKTWNMQNRDPPRSDANSVPVYLLFVNILLKHLHDAGLPMRKRMMQKTAVGCSAASSAAAPIKWRRRPGLQHGSVAINWPNTNHLARARCEHWNVFSSPLPTRCWHLDALTRAGPKVIAVIDLHGYSL